MRSLLLVLGLGASLAIAQTPGDSIKGYWQDTDRRILFSADAPVGYVYGRWTELDAAQTYPSAKEIRHIGNGYELIDLLYDDEEQISVQRADAAAHRLRACQPLLRLCHPPRLRAG